jgi:hypothetical protein
MEWEASSASAGKVPACRKSLFRKDDIQNDENKSPFQGSYSGNKNAPSANRLRNMIKEYCVYFVFLTSVEPKYFISSGIKRPENESKEIRR